MLYKFKSRATADVIMLQANGRQLLHIMGKDADAAHGIITVAQIPAAIAALQAAVLAEEQAQQAARETARAEAEAEAAGLATPSAQDEPQHISLRQRTAPLLDMLRRSAEQDADVTW